MKGIQAAFSKHRKELMVAGAGVVVALGLYQHQKSKSAPAGGDGTAPPAGATIGGYAPAGATGGANYDSTGNDVYNALQPQMEQTQSLLAQLLERLNGGSSSTPTTPTPTPTPSNPAPGTGGPISPDPNHVDRDWSPPNSARPAYTPMTPTRIPQRATPTTAPRPKIPTSTYTVRKGDTLSAIAARLKVGSWSTLYNANKSVIGSNPNLIKPGQKLTIPG